MGFATGSIKLTVCEYASPYLPERFQANTVPDEAIVGEEPVTGWVTGPDLIDKDFDQYGVFGRYPYFGLHTEIRKVPSALLAEMSQKRITAVMRENDMEFMSRKNKIEIKQDVHDMLLKDMPPVSKTIPAVLTGQDNILFLGATSEKELDAFATDLYNTTGVECTEVGAERFAELSGFSLGSTPPEMLRLSPLDNNELVLGREFLTWLWYHQEESAGMVDTGEGQFAYLLDGPLTFAGEGAGALESSVRKGLPTHSKEAKSALDTGKKLTQAALTIARGKDQWTCKFLADTFQFASLTLPEGEELDPSSRFDERILHIQMFLKVIGALYTEYLTAVTSGDCDELIERMINWKEGISGQ